MKDNRKLKVRVKFILFILNSAPQTHDVTCSRLYWDGKNIRRKCQMKTSQSKKHCIRVASQVPNDLRLRILRNSKMLEKTKNWVGAVPILPSRKKKWYQCSKITQKQISKFLVDLLDFLKLFHQFCPRLSFIYKTLTLEIHTFKPLRYTCERNN